MTEYYAHPLRRGDILFPGQWDHTAGQLSCATSNAFLCQLVVISVQVFLFVCWILAKWYGTGTRLKHPTQGVNV